MLNIEFLNSKLNLKLDNENNFKNKANFLLAKSISKILNKIVLFKLEKLNKIELEELKEE